MALAASSVALELRAVSVGAVADVLKTGLSCLGAAPPALAYGEVTWSRQTGVDLIAILAIVGELGSGASGGLGPRFVGAGAYGVSH